MGRPPELARAAVRFSLGRGTTAEEIAATGAAVAAIVRQLQAA
jgi:cysteine sulfinate desulfinase/cysteine desulfurase-like protein